VRPLPKKVMKVPAGTVGTSSKPPSGSVVVDGDILDLMDQGIVNTTASTSNMATSASNMAASMAHLSKAFNAVSMAMNNSTILNMAKTRSSSGSDPAITTSTSAVSAAPSWTLSSLQWLLDNHPHYVTTRSLDTVARLRAALMKMGFGLAMMEKLGGASKEHEQWLDAILPRWNQQSHADLVDFLTNVPYAMSPLDNDRIKNGVPQGGPGASGKMVSGSDPIDPVVVKELKPPAQMSPEHELDALVEQEDLDADPRSGSW
jgi:hypothetical protein